MKKRRLIILLLLGFILLFGTATYVVFETEIRAICSIKKLSNGLYYLEYVGDYGFTSFLENGGASSDEQVAAHLTGFFTRGLLKYQVPEDIVIGCSVLAAKNQEGHFLFGRNLDLHNCTAIIVKTVPTDGYTSISTSNSHFLNLGYDFHPQGIVDRFTMLGSIYVPLDGMNEKGLCVAVNALDYPEQTRQNTGKAGLTTTTALRLLLDRAANVEEALALLKEYDMHSSAYLEYHFAIADATGRSVVVEYIDNEMFATEAPVVTNHFQTPGPLYNVCKSSWDCRYEVLCDHLAENEGIFSESQFKKALADAHQLNGDFGTQWTIVCDQTDLNVHFYHKRDMENAFSFDFN